MHFLSYLIGVCTDFLFPKNSGVLELEALSPAALVTTLPSAQPPPDKDTSALFDYSHPVVKEIVWQLKYGGNAIVADKLGAILYDAILEDLGELGLFEEWGRPILMPIPISDKRRFERGWNQSELLAERLLSRDDQKIFKYLPRQLIKLRHTESQTRTGSRGERLTNLSRSMKVLNPDKVRGRCIIILDDVTTTGATFSEARRALSEAGAKRILSVAVAH
jgi:ComF family protein